MGQGFEQKDILLTAVSSGLNAYTQALINRLPYRPTLVLVLPLQRTRWDIEQRERSATKALG
jgi:hypothetical protein